MNLPSVKSAISMVAVLAATSLGFSLGVQSALAEDASADKLIDTEFENCLQKKIQKRFFNRINASSAQREQLSRLIENKVEQTRPTREEVRLKVVDLAQLLPDKAVSDAEIAEKIKEIQALRINVMDQRVNTIVEVRKILTPEQLQQISDRITGFVTGEWKTRRLGMLPGLR